MKCNELGITTGAVNANLIMSLRTPTRTIDVISSSKQKQKQTSGLMIQEIWVCFHCDQEMTSVVCVLLLLNQMHFTIWPLKSIFLSTVRAHDPNTGKKSVM